MCFSGLYVLKHIVNRVRNFRKTELSVMRTIKITSIIYDDSKYKVFFDSDRKYYFQNKDQAVKFCNRTSKYLNDLLLELNEISIFYYENYRRSIFLIDKKIIIDILEKEFSQINSSIEFCLSNQQTTNYNNFLIGKFSVIFHSIQSISEKLTVISKKCCNTAVINVLRINEKRISQIYDEFTYWNLNLTEKEEVKTIRLQNTA